MRPRKRLRAGARPWTVFRVVRDLFAAIVLTSTAMYAFVGWTVAPGSSGPAQSVKSGADEHPSGAPPLTDGPVIRISMPKPIEIMNGRQDIEAVVDPPASAQPLVVEILVDGSVVARLEAPPYRATFDFGNSLAARRITARLASGAQAGKTAEIVTRGLKVDQVARVDLVTLYVTVKGSGGKYVTDLDQSQFHVFDSGRPQKLEHFSTERRPLAAAVVLDVSFSMKGDPIEAAREAAARFVKTLAPEDRVMVSTFSDQPRIISNLTTDRNAAVNAIMSAEAKGGTALYDAIYMAADRLSTEEGRKVIILLSDGHDEAQNGIEPGSLHTFEEALEKSLRSEVILFTIGFGKKLGAEKDFYGRESLKEILDRLAADSGGTSYYPQRTSQLKSAYELIGEELRNQYSLAYAPQGVRADGSWHPIRIDLTDRSLTAYTRRGYYAPKG